MEQMLRSRHLSARHCGHLWRWVVAVCALLSCLEWLGTYPVSAQGGGVYTVRAGDSLINIAARHGVSASQLAAANGLQWNSWVYVGQRLKIPGQSSSPAGPTTGTGTYVVQPGDTLISIAARHGLTVSQLASMNSLGANAWVYVGQRLKVSGNASTPTQPTQPAPATSATYIVRPGDTLIGIALRHGVTASRLAATNGLYVTSWVYAGQQLKIPGQSSSPAAPSPATGGTYVVRPGDTLISIAVRHGVSVSHLAAANGLYVSAWVYVGQRLKVSGNASTPTQPTQPAPAASGTYIVRPGDTLIGIALRHGVTASRLAATNGLYVTSWVYAGQQLKIPGQSSSPAAPSPATGGTYVVRPGDTLISIAVRHGVSVSHLAAANGLYVSAWVYVGQRLKIPGQGSTPAVPNPAPAAPQPSGSGKWIDVNLSAQSLIAYDGQTAVFNARVSTGIWRYPTVVGTFQVYVKYASTRMVGPGYNLPNVPWTMYFYRGYALHGTYWHNNFGTPMSHGCVNLSIPDAQWLYNWAPVGTRVVTHY